MTCYKCGGVLYHLYHSFENTAPVVEKTNPVVEITKELDINTKIYEYHPATQQKRVETKSAIQKYTTQYHTQSPTIHNRYHYHNKHQHHKQTQQNEISRSIEAVKQINYVGNVKLREIRDIEYNLENQEEKVTQEYEQKNDAYHPKISNRTKIKRERKKLKKEESVEKRIENLEKESKTVKNKIKKEKTSKKNSKSEDILLILEELIGRSYLNNKKTSKTLFSYLTKKLFMQ